MASSQRAESMSKTTSNQNGERNKQVGRRAFDQASRRVI